MNMFCHIAVSHDSIHTHRLSSCRDILRERQELTRLSSVVSLATNYRLESVRATTIHCPTCLYRYILVWQILTFSFNNYCLKKPPWRKYLCQWFLSLWLYDFEVFKIQPSLWFNVHHRFLDVMSFDDHLWPLTYSAYNKANYL